MPKSERSTFTANEAAALCEVDRRTFVRLAEDAGLTVRTLPGMAPRYLRAEVQAFLDRHTVRGTVSAEAVASC